MLTRNTGLAAVAAGLLLATGVVLRVADDINAIRVDAFYILALGGLLGIHVRQAAAQPVLSWLGFAAGLAGLGAGVAGIVLSATGALPPSGGEFGWVSGLALWIGSTALGATMLAIGAFPVAPGLLLTISSPIAMLGLVVRQATVSADAIGVIALVGVAAYGIGWAAVGLSLLRARPGEEALAGA